MSYVKELCVIIAVTALLVSALVIVFLGPWRDMELPIAVWCLGAAGTIYIATFSRDGENEEN